MNFKLFFNFFQFDTTKDTGEQEEISVNNNDDDKMIFKRERIDTNDEIPVSNVASNVEMVSEECQKTRKLRILISISKIKNSISRTRP